MIMAADMVTGMDTGKRRGITSLTMPRPAWCTGKWCVTRTTTPPVYYAPQPAAGIHIMLPNIYIPIR